MRLEPNRKKIVEAILFLIEEAARLDKIITQYEIVKSVFIADIEHIKKYGRPITFDNYRALEFGPVPSETYDMTKPEYPGESHFGSDWPLWERVAAPEAGGKAFKFINPRRPSNIRRLSKSDIQELKSAFAVVKQLGFGLVRDWTHTMPAYVQAWKPTPDRAAFPMRYDLLIETNGVDVATDIAHASKYL
jgi:hypothetical protein